MATQNLSTTSECLDPADMEELSALDGWDLTYMQLGRGSFRGQFRSAAWGPAPSSTRIGESPCT
jgi:hypothetical protein